MIMAGHQPNYLPWLGFFDKMRTCDIFVIEDTVQFTAREFINRNKIKMQFTSQWLTVPVENANGHLPINQMRISEKGQKDWARKHWLSLKYNYSKAPYWKDYCDEFEDAYNKNWTMLCELNVHLLGIIRNILKIKTPMIYASTLGVNGKNNDLIIGQCKKLGAGAHLAGMGAKQYLDVEKFSSSGLSVAFQDFKYPVYNQPSGPFIPNLSVVDYLFSCGPESFAEKVKTHKIALTA